jgi:putative sigma-54 modulation protein
MNINIKTTGIELTDAISDYVYKKIGSIEKYINKNSADIVVQVEVGKSTQHHKSGEFFRAEVHVTGDGLDLYAVEETEDLYASIDKVKDSITREIRRSKNKRFALVRRGEQMAKNMMKGLTAGMDRLKGYNKKDE